MLAWVSQPVLAVIVAIEKLKYSEEHEKGDETVQADYYMKQIPSLDYACGVIACIHAVLNNMESIKLDKDSIFDKFYKMSKDMNPTDRA